MDNTLKAILATFVFLAIGFCAAGEASDPAGTWTTCVNQTGKQIIVEGPRCPRGWRKIY